VLHEKLGVVHSKGFGEFAADRLYVVASCSKMLSAGVLMRLADQGKLAVDKPVGDYLGDWGDAPSSQITIAQMISNSSGMPSLSEVSSAAQDSKSPYYSNLCQYNDAGSLEACGKLLYATTPPRKPDTMFAYGGSQWQLAGAVAEKVSGKHWADLIDETYVQPCQVPSLGYTNHYAKSGTTYPAFFMADKANLPVTDNPSIEGGAYVTAPDYGKLLLMQLRGGKCGDTRVLSEAAVTRMQENRLAQYGGTTGNESMPGYGFGFWVGPDHKMIADPGAYGAYPVLDLERRYGFFFAIELTTDAGSFLAAALKPTLDEIFDDAKL
jgi:CubicO group peptidase (beta-lactamase class C family)